MESAKGSWVYDKKGNKYLDLYGGHAVSLLGHSPEALVDAIEEQGKRLYFYSALGNIEIRDETAKKLISFTRSNLKKVFFCNSGAEANENALKLALQKKKRNKLIGFKGGWHGRTLLCMSVTDDPSWHSSMPKWFGPTDFCILNDESSLNKIDEDTAAVIIEPIQSMSGVNVASIDFLKALKNRCKDVGAWLILDEIQTGLSRTGVPFISSLINPDMATSAKGLASGYPLGALMMSDEIEINPGDLGSTFGGGPMAMAALNKTLSILPGLEKNALLIEEELRSGLNSPVLKEIRGKGCLLGLKLTKKAKDVQSILIEKGFLTGTSGDPYVLRLLPPITISTDEVRLFIKVFNETFPVAS
jgi:acetylornithine/succinyldiaminopimelate/putrescine aminotransferase